MLEKLSQGSQSIFVKIIFGLIIVSFVLAGVGSYLNGPSQQDVAQVNGEAISPQALEQAFQNQRNNLQQQMGDQFTKLAGNPQYMKQLRKSVLENLIDETLLNQKIRDLGLRVGDAEVKSLILSLPAFQKDGQFDNDRYRQLLARSGQTPEQFAMSLMRDLSREQLIRGLVQDDFVLPKESEDFEKLFRQTRDIRYVTIPYKTFVDQIKPDDAAIKAYYEANPQRFMSPAEVKVNYLLLDSKDLAAQVSVTPAEVKTYYQEHQTEYARPEQRHVAQILIKFGSDAKVAKKKADALLAELKGGANFAKLAKEKSEDLFSAKKGGELDWFGKGVMDPAFEKAAFALAKTGDLSAVIKSQYGYQIIKLLGIQAAQQVPLKDVQSEVESTLKLAKAKSNFYDAQQQLADLSFENPDSLDFVAEHLKLKVQHSDFFSQSNPPAALNSPKVLEIAFNPQLRQDNTNSDVITLSDSKVMVLHIVDFKAQKLRPLTQVTTDAKQQLITEQAIAKASSFAKELLTDLKAGKSVEGKLKALNIHFEIAKGVSRQDSKLPSQVLSTLFKMPHPVNGKSSLETVKLSRGDDVVIELNKVVAGQIDEKLTSVMQQQLLDMRQRMDYQAIIKTLRSEGKVEYGDQQTADDDL